MVAINVTSRKGATRTIQAKAGGTLMEALRDNDFEIEAICGGCCSCATCHVFVDPAWGGKLQPRSPDEQELVQETNSYKADASRLSCQIKLSDALSGMNVTVAPED